MKRLAVGLFVLSGVLLAAPSPAMAAAPGSDPSRISGPAAGGPAVRPVEGKKANPVQSCRANNNTVLEKTPGGFEPLELPSFAACVQSLALGRVSWLSYWQNCEGLEQFFAFENPSGQPYPYSFYGNPNYTAANRLDCVYFVWSFHTGKLPPGPPSGAQ